MRSFRRSLLKPRTLLIALCLASAALCFAPPGITTHWIDPAMGLVPFRSLLTGAIHSIVPAPAPQNDSTINGIAPRELSALRNRLISQAAQIEALRRDNLALSRFRKDARSDGRLVSARVVGGDSLPWRQGLSVMSAHSFGGGAGVVTQCSVDRGAESEIDDGMSVLAGESLIGFVDRVFNGKATIRLLGDVESRMPIRLARIEGDEVRILESRFWLTGSLEGRLFVRDVDHEYIEAGDVAIGDTILTVDNDPRLPVPVTIGTVRTLRVHRENRLLFDLEIEPSVAPRHLNRVYIVDANAT